MRSDTINSMKNPDTVVIIPVYNETKVIADVVNAVLKTFSNVVCVNDGSADSTSDAIRTTKAVLIEHCMNLGQGAALQTGIDYALKNKNIQYFVTFDADGQHNIKDVEVMLKTLKKDTLDIVLGSRFLGKVENMPLAKRLLLKTAVGFTNSFSSVKLTDTHNGLRVFTRSFAEALDITAPDMVHASEIIDKIGRNKWKYGEVPITISYTDYSKAKGQSLWNSVNILFDLLITRGKA